MKNWKLRAVITTLIYFFCAEMIIRFLPFEWLNDIISVCESTVFNVCYILLFYLISTFAFWKLIMKNIGTQKHKKFGMIIRTLLISAAAIYVMYVIAMFINGLIYVYF